MCGLACCRIKVSQARHISVFFVSLGSAGSGRRYLVSALLAPASSATTAAASSSALTSLKHHDDHVGSATLLVIRGFFRLLLPLFFFCWCRGIAVAGNSPPASSSAAVWMLAMEIISLRFSLRALYSHVSLCRSKPPLCSPPMKASIAVVSSTFSREFLVSNHRERYSREVSDFFCM